VLQDFEFITTQVTLVNSFDNVSNVLANFSNATTVVENLGYSSINLVELLDSST
jgi:hypothetical protein